MFGKKNSAQTGPKIVDSELLAKAIAKAVADGDSVNFRMLFLSFSPGRTSSSERFEAEKYRYLASSPEEEHVSRFRDALALVRRPDIWAHILRELEANRPALLPWELMLLLGDNAVRLGKYTSGAQAYEVLRIRNKTQQEFFRQADQALKQGDISLAARGYIIGANLEYNYAAYPEAMPQVPDYQSKALVLHGEYPARVDACIGFQPTDVFLRTAFSYLLFTPETATRLDRFSTDLRIQMLREIVKQLDPKWDEFLNRCDAACGLMRRFQERAREAEGAQNAELREDIERTLAEEAPNITAELIGRRIPDAEWWQYLKELAYSHPASVLFIARQVVRPADSRATEILVPRFAADSPIVKALGVGAKAA